ncbi:hypothetical protein [Actinocrispum sp. NPDC049592]|uniref:hypothetical protein n=1 Tax=Actinocrispum sp. NPDC049592 TaxID=3154835 RepID=UPI0034146009
MTTTSSTALFAPGPVSLVAAGRRPGQPIPVSDVPEWLAALVRDLPKPSEYRLAAEYVRAVVDFCLERWRVASSSEAPSVEEAAHRFRGSMTAANDLSHRQVDQLCHRTFGAQGDLPAWLCETTERFLTLIKPWTPVWYGFTNWALRWCRQNSIETLVFLARDALPFFVAATATEQGRHLHLAHVSRAIRTNALTLGPVLRQPSIALIDSGCYGTCINDLRLHRLAAIEDHEPDGLATLFYYSRNPQLFGYLNYVMCQDMLVSPETMDSAGEFIIHAGDLLEALPKPYQYAADDPAMVIPSDLVSFTISIAALSEMDSIATASTFLDPERLNDAHEQVRPLYRNYQLAAHRDELRNGLLFDGPTPKSLPVPAALSGLDFLEIPPQSHIFGTVSG